MEKILNHSELNQNIKNNSFLIFKEEIEKKFVNSNYFAQVLNFNKALLINKKNGQLIECTIKQNLFNGNKILTFVPCGIYNVKTNLKQLTESYLSNPNIDFATYKKQVAKEVISAKLNSIILENEIQNVYNKNAERIIDFELINSVLAEDKKINKKTNNFIKKYKKNIKKILESQKKILYKDVPHYININESFNIVLNENIQLPPKVFVGLDLVEAKDFVVFDNEIWKVKKIIDENLLEVCNKTNKAKKVSAKKIKKVIKKDKAKNFAIAEAIEKANSFMDLSKVAHYLNKIKKIDKNYQQMFAKDVVIAEQTNNYNFLNKKYKEIFLLQENVFENFVNSSLISNKLNKVINITKASENLKNIFKKNLHERVAFEKATKILLEEEEGGDFLNKILNAEEKPSTNNNEEKFIADAEKLLNFSQSSKKEEKTNTEDIEKITVAFAKELQEIFSSIKEYLPDEDETYNYVNNILNFLTKVAEGEKPQDVDAGTLFNIIVLLTGKTDFPTDIKDIINQLKEPKNEENEENKEEKKEEENNKEENVEKVEEIAESKKAIRKLVYCLKEADETSTNQTAQTNQKPQATQTTQTQKPQPSQTNQTQTNQNSFFTSAQRTQLANKYKIANYQKMSDKDLLINIFNTLNSNEKLNFAKSFGVQYDPNKHSNVELADMTLKKIAENK